MRCHTYRSESNLSQGPKTHFKLGSKLFQMVVPLTIEEIPYGWLELAVDTGGSCETSDEVSHSPV
jgi:hypothetical protein